MRKLPYPQRKPRAPRIYSEPRNPSGKRTPRFVKLRLTNLKREPFWRPDAR
jgi:hypothetical protein